MARDAKEEYLMLTHRIEYRIMLLDLDEDDTRDCGRVYSSMKDADPFHAAKARLIFYRRNNPKRKYCLVKRLHITSETLVEDYNK